MTRRQLHVDKPATCAGEWLMAVRECEDCGDLVYPLDACGPTGEHHDDCCTDYGDEDDE